jgi:hypothetical protein
MLQSELYFLNCLLRKEGRKLLVLFQQMKDCIVSVVIESELFDDNEVNDNENPSMEMAGRRVPPPPSHRLSSTFCPSPSPLPSVTNGRCEVSDSLEASSSSSSLRAFLMLVSSAVTFFTSERLVPLLEEALDCFKLFYLMLVMKEEKQMASSWVSVLLP